MDYEDMVIAEEPNQTVINNFIYKKNRFEKN